MKRGLLMASDARGRRGTRIATLVTCDAEQGSREECQHSSAKKRFTNQKARTPTAAIGVCQRNECGRQTPPMPNVKPARDSKTPTRAINHHQAIFKARAVDRLSLPYPEDCDHARHVGKDKADQG